MPRDDEKGKFRVLASLGHMLGLTGDAFISAMKEAVWVPGGVDQLADLIIRTLSTDDVARLVQELPDVPEVMALVGRLLISLNDWPGRADLGQQVIERARAVGPDAVQYLSPYSWYPPVDQIEEILVSPYRLEGASLVLRMRWGGSYQGIEAVWLLRFGAGMVGDAYFITDPEQSTGFESMTWQPLTMDQALQLITLLGLVHSAVNDRFPFDGMVGVGLWMVLAGGREVRPWIDASFFLERDALSGVEVALAYGNALNNSDYAAAFDLLANGTRPDDILDYIRDAVEARKQAGDLWRLDAEVQDEGTDTLHLVLHGWYRTQAGLVARETAISVARDGAGQWRVSRVATTAEQAVPDRERDQYLAGNPRFYALLPVYRMEALADMLPGPSALQQEGVLFFAQGTDVDYRRPFDLGAANSMAWTLMSAESGYLIVFARDEVSLRREVARLQQQQAVGEADRLGVVDLMGQEALQEAAASGLDAVFGLIDQGL